MLNQTDVLKNIQPKTLAEYQELAELENRPKIQRIKEDLWPQFSEYVHRYSIKTGEPRTINRYVHRYSLKTGKAKTNFINFKNNFIHLLSVYVDLFKLRLFNV